MKHVVLGFAFGGAALLTCGCGTAGAQPAQIHQLYAFACTPDGCPNGKAPVALLHASDGNFYGVTQYGGTGGGAAGTVFRFTPDGQLTTLFTFAPDGNGKYPNGSFPTALVQGTDGALYGTTISGGSSDNGAIFRVDTSGQFRLVHSLCYSCGEGADAEFLVLGTDGALYGGSYGVLFRVAPQGAFKVLHTFNSDTEGPSAQGMVLASDGNFYGTSVGGQTLLTVAFRLTPKGRFDALQTFHYSQFPVSPPIQAANGKLYGLLSVDTGHDAPGIFRTNLSGSRFIVSAFQGHGGDLPHYVIQASNRDFWGCRFAATDYPNGVAYKFSPKWKQLDAIAFDSANGIEPDAPLVEMGDGSLIGLAFDGGTAGNGQTPGGTIFAIR